MKIAFTLLSTFWVYTAAYCQQLTDSSYVILSQNINYTNHGSFKLTSTQQTEGLSCELSNGTLLLNGHACNGNTMHLYYQYSPYVGDTAFIVFIASDSAASISIMKQYPLLQENSQIEISADSSFINSPIFNIGIFSSGISTIKPGSELTIDSLSFFNSIASYKKTNESDVSQSASRNSSTSKKEHTFNNLQLELYPNPTTGSLFVYNNSPYDIEIYNNTGSRIINEQNISESSKEIDLTPYSKGIYFVRVKTQEGWQTKKIVYN